MQMSSQMTVVQGVPVQQPTDYGASSSHQPGHWAGANNRREATQFVALDDQGYENKV